MFPGKVKDACMIYDLFGGKPQSEQSFFYYFEEIKQQTNVINLKRQIFLFQALNCVLCDDQKKCFWRKKNLPFPYTTHICSTYPDDVPQKKKKTSRSVYSLAINNNTFTKVLGLILQANCHKTMLFRHFSVVLNAIL